VILYTILKLIKWNFVGDPYALFAIFM